MKHTFDVTFSTHDALKDGVTALGTHRVAVFADTHHEASLIAMQMVAATHDVIPTDLVQVI